MKTPAPGGRVAVRESIGARLADLGWSNARLAEEAGLAFNTVSEFMRGSRDWPRASTRHAMERALGWSPGAMERIATGALAPEEHQALIRSADSTANSAASHRIVFEFPQEVTEGATPAALAEAEAQARVAFLRTLRESRASERPPS
jgi:transcriptional regulator with XRE-family HTH domain